MTFINFIDVYIREGFYPAKLPFVLGQEGAFLALSKAGLDDATRFRL